MAIVIVVVLALSLEGLSFQKTVRVNPRITIVAMQKTDSNLVSSSGSSSLLNKYLQISYMFSNLFAPQSYPMHLIQLRSVTSVELRISVAMTFGRR